MSNNNKPVLSIVIPTVNRATLLEVTLRIAVSLIRDSGQSVELLVCDNASEDNTRETVEKVIADCPEVKYIHFNERVSIDHSFKRSVNASSGEYVWVLGDDDFPLAGSISHFFKAIGNNPECRFFHFERLTADPKMSQGTFSFTVINLADQKMLGREMIQRVFFRPGFISSFLAHRSLWEGEFDFEPYAGYGFIAWIYSRIFNEKVVLMGEPLVVQRISATLWKGEWPRYLLLSQPRILKMLPYDEAEFAKLLNRWRSAYSRPKQFIYNAILARSNLFSSKPQWSEVLQYQSATNRMISCFSKMLPASLAAYIVKSYLSKKHGK